MLAAPSPRSLAVDAAAVALTDSSQPVDQILAAAQAAVERVYANRSTEWLRQRYYKSIERRLPVPPPPPALAVSEGGAGAQACGLQGACQGPTWGLHEAYMGPAGGVQGACRACLACMDGGVEAFACCRAP